MTPCRSWQKFIHPSIQKNTYISSVVRVVYMQVVVSRVQTRSNAQKLPPWHGMAWHGMACARSAFLHAAAELLNQASIVAHLSPHRMLAVASVFVGAHHGCSRTWLMVMRFSTSRSSMSRTRSMLSSLMTQGTRRSWSMISSME